LKAERAWFLDRRERRAKPETEQALPRGGKACVLSNPLTGALKRFSNHSAFAIVTEKLLYIDEYA
jgi:hypothetical protein